MSHRVSKVLLPRKNGSAFRRLVGIVLTTLLLTFALPPAFAQETANWGGIWDSKWRGAGAQIEFTQDGTKVTGIYPLYNGRIEATANGNELAGTWSEGNRQGEFIFVQAPDGASFMGRFESATAEWWTGVRIDAAEYQSILVDQSSPMTTMRSFLQAMNESGADNVIRTTGGGMALAGKAAALISVSEADRDTLNVPDYTHLLFSVIDKTTFRLWNLPHENIIGDIASAVLPQFDTDVRVNLDFRRRDGQWFIAGPPTQVLRDKLAELLAARGTAPDAIEHPGDLKTPRDAFKVLLSGVVDEGDAEAQTALDMRAYNPAVRADEALLLERYLKKVIDRIGYVYWQEIPDDADSTTPYVYFEHPSGNIAIGPVETDKGRIWQFTPDTLANIRALYADVEDVPVAPEFAAFASDDPFFTTRGLARQIGPALLTRDGPIERWQWLMLALALLVGIAFGFLANAVIVFVTTRLYHDRAQRDPLLRIVEWAIRSIFLGVFLLIALRPLGLPEIVGAPVKALAWSAIVIGAVPVGWHLVGRFAEHYRRRWGVSGYQDTLISLMSGVGRVAVLVIAFLLLAEVLALPYEGVIAGLGIGGLAVALAAQPTLQNFLAGLTLYADRPVSVGDFCQFGDKQGTIEHIGMRSTRIRSVDRTIISIPNSEFADMQLENYARRDRIRFASTLQLRCETSADQLRYVLGQLRQLLVNHQRVIEDPCRVRFIGFGSYSLDVEVFTYIMTADGAEFLAIREEILMAMMQVMNDAGVQFAYPAQMEYSTDDLPIDTAKRIAAETKVQAGRAAAELPPGSVSA